jgi:hypothetical protein
MLIIDGSLEVKLPTYGQMLRQSWEESEKRESERRLTSAKRYKSCKKSCELVRVLPMFSGSKAASAELPGGMRSKNACRGAKHVSKYRQKHLRLLTFGALFEVELLKKRARLWCQAHFEINRFKAHHVREHFWTLNRHFS